MYIYDYLTVAAISLCCIMGVVIIIAVIDEKLLGGRISDSTIGDAIGGMIFMTLPFCFGIYVVVYAGYLISQFLGLNIEISINTPPGPPG